LSEQQSNSDQHHRRPVWILLFAAILILTAGFASAQTVEELPASVQVEYDNVVRRLPAADIDQQAAAAAADQRREQIRQRTDGRPKYAKVLATLANFDSDPDPDGWNVEVALLDANDRLVTKRAHATFELMPRIPAADYIGYVDAKMSPIRWSAKLKFDEDGIARVQLPMRERLKPLFSRHAAFLPDPGLGISVNQSRNVVLRRPLEHNRTAFSRDWRANLGRPEFGEFKARISVPTEGVFEAVTPAQMRPSVLVDTIWPYR
jgi:hypothetical protein